MAVKEIEYIVEYMCWLPDNRIGAGLDTDGEAKVLKQIDLRINGVKTFVFEKEAREYIDFIKKKEGKWLAKITLKQATYMDIT